MNMRAKMIVLLAATCWALLIASCNGDRANPEPNPDALSDRQVHQVILYWLDCDDCTDGEFQSVVALGDKAVDFLGQVYVGDPVDGIVVPELEATVLRDLRATYRQLRLAKEGNPDHPGILVSEQEYIDRNVARLNARYQSRAATALREIGTPVAEAIFVGN